MEGHSVIRFNGDVGELWDDETFYLEREAWTDDQWCQDWRDNVIHARIDGPPGF